MTTAPFPQVTDELLSAYIDEAVSDEERRLIELAVAQSPEVAWRLESLRATVRLLRELPALSLPRSFVLTPQQVGLEQAPASPLVTSTGENRGPAPVAPKAANGTGDSFWQEFMRGWKRFWQGGSPALRNAMAASFAVLLALLITPRFLASTSYVSLGNVQTSQEQAAPAMEAPAVLSVPAEPQPAAPETDSAVVTITGDGEAAPADVVPAEAPPPQAASEGAEVAASSAAAAPGVTEPGDGARSAPETSSEGSVTTLASPATEDSAAAMEIEPAAGVVQGDAATSIEVGPPVGVQGSPPSAPESADAAPMPGLAAPSSSGFALDEAREEAGGMAAAPAVAAPPAPVEAAPAAESTAVIASPDQPLEGQATSAKQARGAEEAVQPTVAADTVSEPPVDTAAEDAAVPEIPAAGADDLAAATPAAVAQGAESSEEAPAAPAGNMADDSSAQGAADAATAEQAGVPAWVATALQVAAIVAAFATLFFALLWWRSRRRTRQVNPR